MAQSAHGTDCWPKTISQRVRTGYFRPDMEDNCPLPRRLHHLLSTIEEPIQRLTEVLERFRFANLKKNRQNLNFPNACLFLWSYHQQNGLEADPSKLSAFKKFPIPTSLTEIKSLLGLCYYYRCYVKNFAKIA